MKTIEQTITIFPQEIPWQDVNNIVKIEWIAHSWDGEVRCTLTKHQIQEVDVLQSDLPLDPQNTRMYFRQACMPYLAFFHVWLPKHQKVHVTFIQPDLEYEAELAESIDRYFGGNGGY
jgi:hypothetical protein